MKCTVAGYLYLNRDNRWPDFQWEGLELGADGALRLFSVPLLEGELPEEIQSLGAPHGPAGIAVDIDGTIYFSDPSGHRVLRINGCDLAMAPVPCMGGKGDRPTQLDTPRGLLIPSRRRSLMVADSANHRIQIFDLDSLQLLGILGGPGTEPGRFDTPSTMASDGAGNIYVVDYGNGRVQKFNLLGEVVPAFWDNLRRSSDLTEPRDIAADEQEGALYIMGVDRASKKMKIFAIDAQGHPVLDRAGLPVIIASKHLLQPMGIAFEKDTLYVGDNDRRRVLTYKKKDDSFVIAGEAGGYQGPVAALALDGKGRLLVHTGAALAPVRLAVDKGYRRGGVLWTVKAIDPREAEVNWHRLRADLEWLGSRAHLRFFLHTSNTDAAPPAVDPRSEFAFADPKWRPAPLDAADTLIGGDPACCLWIGAQFTGDGESTAVVSQMRAEFDGNSYLGDLPAIYSEDAKQRDFLLRLLSLFESFFDEVEGAIEGLSALFDPEAVPSRFLPWLAGWLALELDEEWDEAMQRRAIAQAFARVARRGTSEGLRQALKHFAHVEAIVEEPILNAAWWSLPAEMQECEPDDTCKDSREKVWQGTENSVLGVTTMLAPAEAQGAVVGTTAVLDRSHLIAGEEFGAPLFEDVAHRFSVQVYRGELKCAETLSRVRALIEREKPAHTSYHLCIIEPRMRVGFQARVGIDTVVGAPAAAGLRLGETSALGEDAALGGRPAGRLGERSRVGFTTHIG
ncbi:MAG: phage tail protein I [Blastocatellia bacterium]|nr:phage tail protein I [Blastocatellia bacterium]